MMCDVDVLLNCLFDFVCFVMIVKYEVCVVVVLMCVY